MLELDIQKIMQQPNESAREEEIGRQFFEAMHNVAPEDRDAMIAGAISSAILGVMNVRQYCDCLCAAFNQMCGAIKLPIEMINYGDWYDTKDFTQAQRDEWLQQRNEAWRKRQRKIISPT